MVSALVRALFVAKYHRLEGYQDLCFPPRSLVLTKISPLILASLEHLRLRRLNGVADHWWTDLSRIDSLGDFWENACVLMKPLDTEMLLCFPSAKKIGTSSRPLT